MSIQYGHEIIHNSYHKGQLASVKREFEVPVLTSQETLMKDIIDCCKTFTNSETNKLKLEIMRNERGQIRIIKSWKEI